MFFLFSYLITLLQDYAMSFAIVFLAVFALIIAILFYGLIKKKRILDKNEQLHEMKLKEKEKETYTDFTEGHIYQQKK